MAASNVLRSMGMALCGADALQFIFPGRCEGRNLLVPTLAFLWVAALRQKTMAFSLAKKEVEILRRPPARRKGGEYQHVPQSPGIRAGRFRDGNRRVLVGAALSGAPVPEIWRDHVHH